MIKKTQLKPIFFIFMFSLIILGSFSSLDTVKAETETLLYEQTSGASTVNLDGIYPVDTSRYSVVCETVILLYDTVITKLSVSMLKVNSPDTYLKAFISDLTSIQFVSGSYPNGTRYGETESSAIQSSSLTTSQAWYNFTFSPPLEMDAGVYAFGVYVVNGTASGTNYVRAYFANTDVKTGVLHEHYNGAWTTLVNYDLMLKIYGYVEEVATPTPTPTPDGIMPVVTGLNAFLFGESGTLGAGFGLIVMLAVTFIFFAFGGKSLVVLLLAVNVATFVNLAVGIWELWTLIIIIIIDVAIALKSSGIIGGGGGGGEM